MASAWNVSGMGARGDAVPGRQKDSPARAELHDRLVDEYQQRGPEGANAPARLRHRLAAGAAALALVGVVILIYGLGIMGGWAAVGLAAMILALFVVLALSGPVYGGVARVRERAGIEAEVVKDVDVIRSRDLTDTGEGADRT